MHAAPSAESSHPSSTELGGPDWATARAQRALSRVRPFQLATTWLVVILVAWITMLVTDWDRVAFVALGVGFGGLLTCRLPLPRRAEWALAWCMSVSFLGALPSSSSPTQALTSGWALVIVIAVIVGFLAGSIVAFCMAMRELARAAGASESVDRWRSVQHWYLGALAGVLLLILASLPSATRTGPHQLTMDDIFAGPALLMMLVLVGAMIYAVVAHVSLVLHLRRSFGLRGLVERGDLVLRQDAWGPAAPRPFVYQATPPPWESSTSLS